MSRSYKKNPIIKNNKSKKPQKKTANHKVRQKLNKVENEEVGNNANFKKHFEQWDICDFKMTCTFDEYWEMEISFYALCCEKGIKVTKPDRKKCYREWYKKYKMK